MSDANVLRDWTVQRVIAALPRLGRGEQSEPLSALADQRDPLCDALRRAMAESDGITRLNAAVMLLKLQDPAGRDIFLEALGSNDAALSEAAAQFLPEIAPEDSRDDSRYPRYKVPVSGADIFAALSARLVETGFKAHGPLLFFCLKHDIETSLPVTRPLLRDASDALRLFVADWFLRNGRDDGALRVIEALFASAPENPQSQEPRWYDLKVSWLALDECCRVAAEPLRTDAARMAMRIVEATLDAPDCRVRTHVNNGFVDIGTAARAIGRVMPEGAEELLKHIIAGNFDDFDQGDDYSRGQAVMALAKATGAKNRNFVRALLADRALRQYAAQAIGEIGKGSNDKDDIAALAHALAEENRRGPMGEILAALAGMGPDAKPHVSAALDRADPWSAMQAVWRIEGLSARRIADLLAEAGAIDAISDAELAAQTRNGVDLIGIAVAAGRRMAMFNTDYDPGTAPWPLVLFKALLDVARPRIQVPTLEWADEPYIISFDLGGRTHSFILGDGWPAISQVVDAFNKFLASLDRNDRCFELADPYPYAFFLVADKEKFPRLAERLYIPLKAATGTTENDA